MSATQSGSPGRLSETQGPGSSGAPVVTRHGKLLGVHSARFEMKDADAATDDSLGLNCAWYADILLTLTG